MTSLENAFTDLVDFFFCCVHNCQVYMKENFRKIHRKVGNLNAKNTSVAPAVQKKKTK